MSGYVTPSKLALMLGVVKQNRTQALQEYAVMNRALAAGMYEVTLDHAFETADIYPAFTPNWNTVVYLDWVTSTKFKVKFGTEAQAGSALTYRISRYGGTISVAALATTATLTHNANDATVRYFFTPSWDTTVYASAKAANSTTLRFSNISASAQTVRYVKFDSVDGQSVSPTASANTTLVTHNQGQPFTHAFFTPSWNSVVYPLDRTRTDNALQVVYQSPPPSGANLDVATGDSLIG